MLTRYGIKLLAPIIAAIAVVVVMLMNCTTAQAAPQHGFGTGDGRTAPITINDFHTAAWDRFIFNYRFESGSNHRFELATQRRFTASYPLTCLR